MQERRLGLPRRGQAQVKWQLQQARGGRAGECGERCSSSAAQAAGDAVGVPVCLSCRRADSRCGRHCHPAGRTLPMQVG